MKPNVAQAQKFEIAQLFHDNSRILVMGVVNATPDSFSDGGRFLDPQVAVEHARRLHDEGADIIDVGGESSRPGAASVDGAEETARVLPVIEALAGSLPIPISIDTTKAAVAETALVAGARIVNDISALGDPRMAETVARHDAGLVLMHKRGLPLNMQQDTHYRDLIAEVIDFLGLAIETAESAGIDPEKIMIDPGIGFGKSADGNFDILRSLRQFVVLNKPILVGASRKSFIGKVAGGEVDDRLAGSLAAATAAVMNGAHCVRVHDVRATRQAVDLAIHLREKR